MLTAALAAVVFDIVEAREESLGPESSKTMAGVVYRGKKKSSREMGSDDCRKLVWLVSVGWWCKMQEAGFRVVVAGWVGSL